ncbi:hypothetical protein ACLI1A_01085 [Flavobacterium sp. RHBU_3]|uniref:hypothetical protein n=1 Tax=Flavobacterium sp. RHBU_3 TaxID=3391184 RepID=UPI0039853A31
MQRKYIQWLLPVVLFAVNLPVHAQCAMCRAALESNDQGVQPEAVNDGIVYLMAFPYLLVGIVGFIVYRMRQKSIAKKEAQ